jgi:hypothetical protein
VGGKKKTMGFLPRSPLVARAAWHFIFHFSARRAELPWGGAHSHAAMLSAIFEKGPQGEALTSMDYRDGAASGSFDRTICYIIITIKKI